LIRYLAAACQTDFPNPTDRTAIPDRVGHMLGMIDRAVIGYRPFGDVKLVVFPEFGHAAPIYETVAELADRLAVPIPNEHTHRYHQKSRDLGIYVQTGSFLEVDTKYPGCVFNTTCLIGPEGLLYKYRKVHPWLPWRFTPARTTSRLRGEPVPGGRNRNRRAGLCDLLRLAVPGSDSRTRAAGRGSADSRVRTWTRGARRRRWTGGRW